ncbi:hypothetical protein C1646_673869 [Rhizophagus diaphanus]|nr:hypothetical protein C1646_673869 [Rhizophagus diaphanus] [Rhizophagus sp. MUCL 43196]
MASSSTTKHIVIDWSTPPTNSFAQLGLTLTPQKDSNNYVQDFEQEVVLTTKDILYLDIDDILSPSSFTAPQYCRKNFPFFVSFKKTHTRLWFSRQKIFQDIISKKDQSPLNQEKNSKAFHANLIFKQWQNLEWKDVYSKCTGISYRSRYILPGYKNINHHPRTRIYNKLMKGFNYQPSPNTKVAKRQQCHFECTCRRVLKKEVIKPGGTSNVASKLGAARISNFLFLPSQTINKRIQHIRIQNIKHHPENPDLAFSTPFDHKYKKRLKCTEQSSTLTEITIELQVVVLFTKSDSNTESAKAISTGWDSTFYFNKMKKINNLMNWSDKFHKDKTDFVKQYDRIITKHSNMNTPDDKKSKKKHTLTFEAEMSNLYY